MYKVRIEHSGYDTCPFRFEHRYQATGFIEALMAENGVTDGRLYLSIEEVPDEVPEEEAAHE